MKDISLLFLLGFLLSFVFILFMSLAALHLGYPVVSIGLPPALINSLALTASFLGIGKSLFHIVTY